MNTDRFGSAKSEGNGSERTCTNNSKLARVLSAAAVLAMASIATASPSQARSSGYSNNYSWVDSILQPQVIYGTDGRADICEEADEARLASADATVALIESKDMIKHEDGSYSIRTESYQETYELCPSERFVDQDIAAVCSGFLVAPDIMVTAGHCIFNARSCEDTKIVFNFSVKKPGDKPRTAKADEVYSCAEIIESTTTSGDFAVIRLDREVEGHKPVKLRRSGKASKGEEIYVVGHPAGLPAKIATGAQIRGTGKDIYSANLDTFAGNSGSPVFNARTHEVEGILVAGEVDYVQQGKCFVSNKCSDQGCRGEDITAISKVLPYVK